MIAQAELQQQLRVAESSIKASGTRLTVHRQKLLGLLCCSSRPLSAYEITELFNDTDNEHVIANSVYRTLNDLIKAQLVHRLNTINKYVASNSPEKNQETTFPLFIICSKCLYVEEEQAPDFMVKAAFNKTMSDNFEQITPQLELTVLCSSCHNKQHPKRN